MSNGYSQSNNDQFRGQAPPAHRSCFSALIGKPRPTPRLNSQKDQQQHQQRRPSNNLNDLHDEFSSFGLNQNNNIGTHDRTIIGGGTIGNNNGGKLIRDRLATDVSSFTDTSITDSTIASQLQYTKKSSVSKTNRLVSTVFCRSMKPYGRSLQIQNLNETDNTYRSSQLLLQRHKSDLLDDHDPCEDEGGGAFPSAANDNSFNTQAVDEFQKRRSLGKAIMGCANMKKRRDRNMDIGIQLLPESESVKPILTTEGMDYNSSDLQAVEFPQIIFARGEEEQEVEDVSGYDHYPTPSERGCEGSGYFDTNLNQRHQQHQQQQQQPPQQQQQQQQRQRQILHKASSNISRNTRERTNQFPGGRIRNRSSSPNISYRRDNNNNGTNNHNDLSCRHRNNNESSNSRANSHSHSRANSRAHSRSRHTDNNERNKSPCNSRATSRATSRAHSRAHSRNRHTDNNERNKSPCNSRDNSRANSRANSSYAARSFAEEGEFLDTLGNKDKYTDLITKNTTANKTRNRHKIAVTTHQSRSLRNDIDNLTGRTEEERRKVGEKLALNSTGGGNAGFPLLIDVSILCDQSDDVSDIAGGESVGHLTSGAGGLMEDVNDSCYVDETTGWGVESAIAEKAKRVDERSNLWRYREGNEGNQQEKQRQPQQQHTRSDYERGEVRSSRPLSNSDKKEPYIPKKAQSLIDVRSSSLMDQDISNSQVYSDSFFSVENEGIIEAKKTPEYPFRGTGYRTPRLSLSEAGGANIKLFGGNHVLSDTFEFEGEEEEISPIGKSQQIQELKANRKSMTNLSHNKLMQHEMYHHTQESRRSLSTIGTEKEKQAQLDSTTQSEAIPSISRQHQRNGSAISSLRRESSFRSSKYCQAPNGATIKIERQQNGGISKNQGKPVGGAAMNANIVSSSGMKKPKSMSKRNESGGSGATRQRSNTTTNNAANRGNENLNSSKSIGSGAVLESKVRLHKIKERRPLSNIGGQQQQHEPQWSGDPWL